MTGVATLTTAQAGERMQCSAQEVCRKIRMKQIPDQYVIKGKRFYRIKAAYFDAGMPTNVVPFSRQSDMEEMGRVIAREMLSEFVAAMSAALDRVNGSAARKVG